MAALTEILQTRQRISNRVICQRVRQRLEAYIEHWLEENVLKRLRREKMQQLIPYNLYVDKDNNITLETFDDYISCYRRDENGITELDDALAKLRFGKRLFGANQYKSLKENNKNWIGNHESRWKERFDQDDINDLLAQYKSQRAQGVAVNEIELRDRDGYSVSKIMENLIVYIARNDLLYGIYT
jgi:hypothetical protein